MALIEEYFTKDKYYKNEYGDKTFLLYQVGSFFEVYGLKNDDSYKNIQKFAELAGLAVADKKVCVRKKRL